MTITTSTESALLARNLNEGLTFGGKTTFQGESLFEKLVSFLGDVIFTGRPTFNKDTAGYAIVKKGQRRVDVVFDKEYVQPPIITANALWDIDSDILPNADKIESFYPAVPNYIITGVTTKGFSIITDIQTVTDLRFSWIAIAVKDARTFESPEADQPVQSPTSSQPTVTINPTPTPTILNPTIIPAATESAGITEMPNQ